MMIKGTISKLALSTAVLGMMAGGALAADPVQDYAHDWSGFYLGVHAGYGFTDYSGIFDIDGTDYDFSRNDDEGFLAGVQLGYNHQIDAIVLGIEGDLTMFDTSTVEVDDPGDEDNLQKVGFEGLASVRGRLGFAADSVHLYGTGGVGFAEYYTHTEFNENRPSDKRNFSSTGFVIGAGAEMMVTDNISVRAEYLHYIFNDRKNFPDSIVNDADTGDFFKLEDVGTARLGVNWHF